MKEAGSRDGAVVKTTNFQLVFNFEQMHTVTLIIWRALASHQCSLSSIPRADAMSRPFGREGTLQIIKITVRVCSKLKTSWKSVFLQRKSGRVLDKVLTRRVSSRPMDAHVWKKHKENSPYLLYVLEKHAFWTASFQCLAKSLVLDILRNIHGSLLAAFFYIIPSKHSKCSLRQPNFPSGLLTISVQSPPSPSPTVTAVPKFSLFLTS